jgi:predicted secreted protein
MDPVSGIVVFVIAFWLCLFIALPIGVQSQQESGEVVPGSERGAPVKANLGTKAKWAAIAAAVITALFAIGQAVFFS